MTGLINWDSLKKKIATDDVHWAMYNLFDQNIPKNMLKIPTGTSSHEQEHKIRRSHSHIPNRSQGIGN